MRIDYFKAYLEESKSFLCQDEIYIFNSITNKYIEKFGDDLCKILNKFKQEGRPLSNYIFHEDIYNILLDNTSNDIANHFILLAKTYPESAITFARDKLPKQFYLDINVCNDGITYVQIRLNKVNDINSDNKDDEDIKYIFQLAEKVLSIVKCKMLKNMSKSYLKENKKDIIKSLHDYRNNSDNNIKIAQDNYKTIREYVSYDIAMHFYLISVSDRDKAKIFISKYISDEFSIYMSIDGYITIRKLYNNTNKYKIPSIPDYYSKYDYIVDNDFCDAFKVKLLRKAEFLELEEKNMISNMSNDYLYKNRNDFTDFLNADISEDNKWTIERIFVHFKQYKTYDIAIHFRLLSLFNIDRAIRFAKSNLSSNMRLIKNNHIFSIEIYDSLYSGASVDNINNEYNRCIDKYLEKDFIKSFLKSEGDELNMYEDNIKRKKELLEELKELDINIKYYQTKCMEEKIQKRVGKSKFSKLPVIVFGKIGTSDLYAIFSIKYIGNGEYEENNILWSDNKYRTKDEFVNMFVYHDIQDIDFTIKKKVKAEIVELETKKSNLEKQLNMA